MSSSCVSPLTCLTSLRRLQARKLNLSKNHLERLPISLGALPRPTYLLINKNKRWRIWLIKHLQVQYRKSQSELTDMNAIKELSSERGSVFDFRVLNMGLAQSLFAQLKLKPSRLVTYY